MPRSATITRMKTKQKVMMVCTHCGKPMLRYACSLKPGCKPYCSQSCLSDHRRHGSLITCDQCGGQVYRRFGEQDREVRKKQFCSISCYHQNRKDNMKITVYPKRGSVHIHRIEAEHLLGRPLRAGEVVHHIDGDKHNNSKVNLLVFRSQVDHAAYHARKSGLGKS